MSATTQAVVGRDVYSELGLVPVINARGNQTLLGGSILTAEAQEVMEAANRYFVDMDALLKQTGRIAAELLECEAAYITSGCAAALTLGAAACLVGGDAAKMQRLPDTRGMKHQIVIQARHHYKYEHVTTIVGAKLVEAGDANGTTPAQLEAAFGPETAMVLFTGHLDKAEGTVPLAQVAEIAHRKGVPVLVDAASQIYPLERMLSWTKIGADLVGFGAKYFGAPHSSGMLIGRKDLVDSAARQGFIGFEVGASSFGRPMKLDRGEILAVLVALRAWLAMDHAKRIARARRKVETIAAAAGGTPGVTATTVPGIHLGSPGLRVSFGAGSKLTAAGVTASLKAGSPSIVTGMDGDSLMFNVNTLHDGDEELIADRLRELLAH